MCYVLNVSLSRLASSILCPKFGHLRVMVVGENVHLYANQMYCYSRRFFLLRIQPWKNIQRGQCQCILCKCGQELNLKSVLGQDLSYDYAA